MSYDLKNIISSRGRSIERFFQAILLGSLFLAFFWDGKAGKPSHIAFPAEEVREDECEILELADVLMSLEARFDEVALVDVRSFDDYKISHIQMAVPAYTDSCSCDLSACTTQIIAEKPLVVVYGIRGQDFSSFFLKLPIEHRKKVYCYSGGINEWRACGLPLTGGFE